MMTMNMTTTEIMRILAETGSYVELFSVKFVEMIGQLFINPCSSKCIGWLVKALSEVMGTVCKSVSFSFETTKTLPMK